MTVKKALSKLYRNHRKICRIERDIYIARHMANVLELELIQVQAEEDSEQEVTEESIAERKMRGVVLMLSFLNDLYNTPRDTADSQ